MVLVMLKLRQRSVVKFFTETEIRHKNKYYNFTESYYTTKGGAPRYTSYMVIKKRNELRFFAETTMTGYAENFSSKVYAKILL